MGSGLSAPRHTSPGFGSRKTAFGFRRITESMEHSVTVLAETTMDAAALGLKRIREQHFVMEDLADPVTVELVTATQHKVSLKKVMEWMAIPKAAPANHPHPPT
jgi:hypothetical protein